MFVLQLGLCTDTQKNKNKKKKREEKTEVEQIKERKNNVTNKKIRKRIEIAMGQKQDKIRRNVKSTNQIYTDNVKTSSEWNH